MRLDPTSTNVALACLLPVSIALFATRRPFPRSWSVVLLTLALFDLAANLAGFGAFFWWSPFHWPSTFALGADEILENHGVAVTTAGYILDLVAWSAVITWAIALFKRKRSASAR